MPSSRTPCHGPLTSRRQRSEARNLALLPRPFSLLSPLPSPLPHWTPPPPNWTHSPKKWTHCPQKWTHPAENWTHWPVRVDTSRSSPAIARHPGVRGRDPAPQSIPAHQSHPGLPAISSPPPARLSLLAAHSALSPGEPALSPSKEPDPVFVPLPSSPVSLLSPLPSPLPQLNTSPSSRRPRGACRMGDPAAPNNLSAPATRGINNRRAAALHPLQGDLCKTSASTSRARPLFLPLP